MKRSLWTLTLLAAFAIAVSGGAAHAIPSLAGPTGIVSTPNALVAPPDKLQTALIYQQQEVSAGMYSVDIDQWQLNVLTGVGEEAELWAAYALADQESPTVSDNANMWALGGKWQLAAEPEDQASLAVGGSWESWSDSALAGMASMYDAGAGVDDMQVLKAYIVATKDFTPQSGSSWEWSDGSMQMLGSVGLMYMKVDPDGNSSESLTKPFVGLEFVGADGTTFGLEYRWKDSDIDMDAVFSAMLRHAFSPEVEAEIGITNAGPSGIGLDDSNFYFSLGYNIPLGGA
jgi:hypothetical protein